MILNRLNPFKKDLLKNMYEYAIPFLFPSRKTLFPFSSLTIIPAKPFSHRSLFSLLHQSFQSFPFLTVSNRSLFSIVPIVPFSHCSTKPNPRFFSIVLNLHRRKSFDITASLHRCLSIV